MKPRGHRSERARARLEFRHSKPTRGSVANPFGHSRGSLTPDGVYEPYSDPFASFSLFQRRCRARSAGEYEMYWG